MKTLKFFALLFSLNLLVSFAVNGQNWYGSGIKGEGPKVTQELDLKSFDSFSLNFSGHVYLKQGPQSVIVEAQQNILDNIETDVNAGYWKIKFDKNVRNHDGVKIWISIPDLTSARVSGSGDIQGKEFTGLGNLDLAVSGSGDIELEFQSKSLEASISGSGDMELAGRTGNCDFRISGSGDIEAEDLEADNCKVKISGSGDASVHVNGSLEVGISGSGDVVYGGSPKVRSKISGSGDVKAN